MGKKIIDQFNHLTGKAAWRKRHPQYAGQIAARQRAKRKEWFQQQKDRPCADCGQKYLPCQMDWDHVRGHKAFTVGPSYHCARSRVAREIEKCDLVCANCHRLRTHQRRTR